MGKQRKQADAAAQSEVAKKQKPAVKKKSDAVEKVVVKKATGISAKFERVPKKTPRGNSGATDETKPAKRGVKKAADAKKPLNRGVKNAADAKKPLKRLQGVKNTVAIRQSKRKIVNGLQKGLSELKKILKTGPTCSIQENDESTSVVKKSIKGAKKIAVKATQKFKRTNSKLNQRGEFKTVDPVQLNRGVVLLSHLPHGFYEEEIKEYFSQFGVITGVNLPRAKSGRIKGYAFIEFKHPEVAQVAAETMNNYLMLQRLLKAKYIPPEEQKPYLFKPRKSLKDKTDCLKLHRVENENNKLTKRKKRNMHRKLNKLGKLSLKNKFKKDGIEYDFEIVTDKEVLLTGMKQIDSEA